MFSLSRALITFAAPLPRKICGYLAFILHFSSPNHFTEPLWSIPPAPLQSSYYSTLLASLWKLLTAVSTECVWIAFTKENFSKDSCPESKNNHHLKLECFLSFQRKKKDIINLNSEHSTPIPLKDKNVRIKESIVSSIWHFSLLS